MTGDQNWRTEVDAGDYFVHQKKQLQVADRRPVIRRASDLVGPGIAAAAIVITDFDDLLATYNGYYSAVEGTTNAPNANEAFIGTVTMDATLGGQQAFTGLESGIEYTRLFLRNPSDSSSITWGAWTAGLVDSRPVGEMTMFAGNSIPDGWLVCNGDSFSSDTYPALAAVLGDTFGVHSGVVYYLPDLTDRFPIGVGAGALGDTGGSATKTIGTTNLPAHTHGAGSLNADSAGSDHTHSVDVGNATPGTVNDTLQRGSVSTAVSAITNPFDSQTAGITGAHSHGVSGTTGSTGSGTALDVMNPWLALNFIIRAV